MSEPQPPPDPSAGWAQKADLPVEDSDLSAESTGSAGRPVRTSRLEQAGSLASRPLPERYQELTVIGRGGAGEVHRAIDRNLNRLVALKTLRPKLARDDGMVARFMHEAQVVAQLEHPAIVPVHDLGQLPDGRWFITMKEIQGRTLRELIAALHRARRKGPFVPTADGWTLRRVIQAFRSVAEAVAFSHSKNVLHRDLKPDNVMIGEYGEVYLVDWGLAKVLDDAAGPEPSLHGELQTEELEPVAGRTEHGMIIGTPAYMPPEQALGDPTAMGPWSDVWALGAVLYAVLYGRPPYKGKPQEVLDQVVEAPPTPPRRSPAPGPLCDIWRRCMQMDPFDRYPNASQVASELGAWLEGSQARERAMVHVREASELLPDLRDAQQTAARGRERARAALVSLRPSDDLQTKEAAWALEDQAAAQQVEVDALYQKISARARLALTQVPDLPEARVILADVYREQAEAAEAEKDAKAAREYRALLTDYDDGQHADFLREDGALSLATDPDGAEVRVYRYERRARRLGPVKMGVTGPTPINRLRLPVGSYLLDLHAKDGRSVRYPMRIGRGDPWLPIRPGADSLAPVRFPEARQLHPSERLVPAGWFISGGDGDAIGALPRQQLWVDRFAIAYRPTSHADYLFFLNDLLQNGNAEAAASRVPHTAGDPRHPIEPLYSLTDGAYSLRPRVDDLALQAESPVICVTWYDALAYCVWLTARTRLPWRLPCELEREKATRGVDGRPFPWGEQADPAFHCMQDSSLRDPGPPPPSQFQVDQSPYGVLGLAGGVQEWCTDVSRPRGPERRGSRVIAPPPPTEQDASPQKFASRRVIRGGAWDLPSRACRGASRTAAKPDRRATNLGFRICRTLD